MLAACLRWASPVSFLSGAGEDTLHGMRTDLPLTTSASVLPPRRSRSTLFPAFSFE